MKKLKLWQLAVGETFRYNNKIYTVMIHEGAMVEVFDGKRYWAWPSKSLV